MAITVIPPRTKDLGGFSVRRLLPYVTHRMIGPFIFLDHMGPAKFAPGQGIDVRPHPHIGLATVTYLFEGKIHHRDSLGNDQYIEPGAVNWMTAGRGIVHSERAPAEVAAAGGPLNGLQCWVALPVEHEETEPSFTHYPASELPEFELQGVKIKLLVGSALGHQSPVKKHSDLFYFEARMKKGSKLFLPADGREAAAYLASGTVSVNGTELELYSLGVAEQSSALEIQALEDARIMVLGGSPVGERLIYWNFVASSQEKIDRAKTEWKNGPGSTRFPRVPGDEADFIPLPKD